MARKSAPMPHNRYRHLLSADFALGPLSLISVVLFSARERSCQGRRLVSPAQRTLDRKAPSLIIGALGKGGGVSGGFAPLAEYEAAPHGAQRAPRSASRFVMGLLLSSCLLRLCRHTSIRTLIAAVLRCGAHWCSQFKGCCHLSCDLRVAHFRRLPTARRNLAVTPTRRLRIPLQSSFTFTLTVEF